MQTYLPSVIKVNKKTGNVCITQHWGTYKHPLLQWKSGKYYTFQVSICCFKYPACYAHEPYCHIWPVLLYNIFQHYLTNSMIFRGKKLLNIKCVFSLCLQLLSEKFLILKRNERDIIINVYLSSLFLSDFNETSIFLTNFLKILKYLTSWKSVQWQPCCSM